MAFNRAWNDADLTDGQRTGLSSPNFKSQQIRDLQDKLLQHFLVDCCHSLILCWDLSLVAPMQTLQETGIGNCQRAAAVLPTAIPAHDRTKAALCRSPTLVPGNVLGPSPGPLGTGIAVSLPWSLWRSCRRGPGGGWPGSRPGPCGPSRRSSAPARWPSPPSQPAGTQQELREMLPLTCTTPKPRGIGAHLSSGL